MKEQNILNERRKDFIESIPGMLLSLFIFLFIIISFIQLISAETIYAGENLTIKSEFEIVDCEIINNLYNLDGLNLSWSDYEIFISTETNYKPDNFSVYCNVIKYKEEPPIWYSFGSGSSSSSSTPVVPVENKTEEVVEEKVEEEVIEEKEEVVKTIPIWFIILFIIIFLIILVIVLSKLIIKKNGDEDGEEITQDNNSG